MTASLTFIESPPGFDALVDFTLEDVAGAPGLFVLRPDSERGIRMFVIDASLYLPDYAPVLSDTQAAALELTRAEDALLLVVANPGDDGTTVNLMAPIVVNSTTGRCAQVILDDAVWPLRAPLRAA
ncbi:MULTISPECIES: flagellar assembly protein FliW [unclassified Cryobacterium]|uniref:flagellar assembly protein FliW n=1 Tax=unclassified Cryobacterium TaxID=2649013 RepID=UPI001444ADA2|nr:MULTISPECIES: flagellar assembly protein FliW [unclassified Cryobacterium]